MSGSRYINVRPLSFLKVLSSRVKTKHTTALFCSSLLPAFESRLVLGCWLQIFKNKSGKFFVFTCRLLCESKGLEPALRAPSIVAAHPRGWSQPHSSVRVSLILSIQSQQKPRCDWYIQILSCFSVGVSSLPELSFKGKGTCWEGSSKDYIK